MKKIVAILALTGMVSCAFGQGLVSFANSSTQSPVSTNNGSYYLGGSSGAGSSATGLAANKSNGTYYYALLMQAYSGSGPLVTSTLSNVLTSGWTFQLMGTNTLAFGGIGGGGSAALPSSSYAAAGANNQFLVVGWSGGLGSTWATVAGELQNALNGTTPLAGGNFIGITSTGWGVAQTSAVETLFGTSGTGILTPTTLFSTTAPVPEPGTLALAAIGGASLLLFRRKK